MRDHRWLIPAAVVMITGTGLLAGPAMGPSPEPTPQHSDDVFVGVSRPADVRELAFAVRGKVSQTLVEPGDRVQAGEALIRLDDAVQAATLALARAQAGDDSQVALAKVTLEFRRDEHRITSDSASRGGANEQDVRTARFALDRAEIEHRGAEAARTQLALSVEREAARLADMTIAAPITGDVIEVHKKAGETVDELTTVVTLVDIDKLRIDITVPPALARQLAVGQPAQVRWTDVQAPISRDGRIIFIPATGDPTVREVAVRIEVPNPDRLPSGLHAEVTFPALTPDKATP